MTILSDVEILRELGSAAGQVADGGGSVLPPPAEKRKEADDMTARIFGPKTADHPSVGKPCPTCGDQFTAGDYTTLATLGPGKDPEAQARARVGLPYNAIAVEVHATCGGMQPPSGSSASEGAKR